MNLQKKIRGFHLFLVIILVNISLYESKLYAQRNQSSLNEGLERNETNKLDVPDIFINKNYLKVKDEENFYILGPGDKFNLRLNQLYEIDNTKSLGGNYLIDNDGIVTLPRIKRVKVSGLTIKELTELLNKEFSLYLKNVDVTIEIIQYRIAKIYLDGAVMNPGLHLLNIGKVANIPSNNSIEDFKDKIGSGSTLFDALQTAGGVNFDADLGNIEVTRINSISNGGGRIKTTLNLFNTLDLSDLSQNINLRDGDTIFIPSIKDIKSLGLNKILKSNINPKFINIYVSGRVKEPGIKKLSSSSTLVDSINISGGAKVVKGKVKFLRYKNDGTVDNRSFRYNKRAKRGSYKNPYLLNGDIIFIEDNFLSVSTQVLNEITDPLRSLLSAYTFFKIIDD